MKFLFDFFPIVLFFIAYKMYDMFVATGVIIVASILQVSFHWYKHRRFEKMHVITLLLVVVLGGATILLHDENFIKWKPTIVNWLFAVAFLGSHFIGKKTVIERMLDGNINLPAEIWKRLNMSWIIFFVLMGVLNVYIAFYYALELSHDARNDIWVNFKLFGMMGLTLAFTVAQAFYLAKHMQDEKTEAITEQSGDNS